MAARRGTNSPAPADALAEEDLPDYCARPACRQSFTRTAGRGRRQAYCSEICRRAAERELRQTRARLDHYEHVVGQLRVDIAAFGADTSSDLGQAPDTTAASTAVARVGGILAFLENSEDPLARELRALHDAVQPLINAGQSQAVRPAVGQ